MSLFTVLGLWVALSFLASPLIGAFIYRQTRMDRYYAAKMQAATSAAQIAYRRPEVAVRQIRRVGRPVSISARAIKPVLQ